MSSALFFSVSEILQFLSISVEISVVFVDVDAASPAGETSPQQVCVSIGLYGNQNRRPQHVSLQLKAEPVFGLLQ